MFLYRRQPVNACRHSLRPFSCDTLNVLNGFLLPRPSPFPRFPRILLLYPCFRPRPASLLHKISLITVFRVEKGVFRGQKRQVRASQTHK